MSFTFLDEPEPELAPDASMGHHRLVGREIGSIRGIGALTVYDVAHRIGMFLGKSPDLIYLHAGTRAGAAALGFRGDVLDPTQLPAAFAVLTTAEIEDCLCIYKDLLRCGRFRTGVSQQPSTCRPSPLCCVQAYAPSA